MTDSMKAFLEQMNQNQALKDELEALGKKQLEKNKDAVTQKALEIAAKHGFTLKAEDMETMEAETTELTEGQLKAAAGGDRRCICPVIGGGGGFENGGFCACISSGFGTTDNGTVLKCACVIGGAGLS